MTSSPSPDEARAIEAAADTFAWREQAHGLLVEHDLLSRSPAVYWTDLVLSAGFAWAMTFAYFTARAFSVLQIVSFLAAGVLFYRAGTFIHEIVHMPARQMAGFKRVWNVLVGIPFLMPWIMYRNHVEHHSPRQFGTPDDGEYLPLASSPVVETVKYLAQAPLLPLFMVTRFGVLGPLSWLHRGLREWVMTAASAAVSNPYYRKRFPKRDEGHLRIVEALCLGYLVAVGGLVWFGVIAWHHVFMAYLLLAYTLGLNWVRNLAAHRYANGGGQMTHEDQFADSINITGQTWLTVMMFPVGLRYHALHHLFPALPYHRMGAAHRLLMQRLPAEARYAEANRGSFFAAVADLWRSARQTDPERSAMQVWLPKSKHT